MKRFYIILTCIVLAISGCAWLFVSKNNVQIFWKTGEVFIQSKKTMNYWGLYWTDGRPYAYHNSRYYTEYYWDYSTNPCLHGRDVMTMKLRINWNP